LFSAWRKQAYGSRKTGDRHSYAGKTQAIPAQQRRDEPLPATAENIFIAAGKLSFSHYCVACHGLDAQNAGVPFSDNRSPPAPSLASKQVQSYTDGPLKWVIDNGIWPSAMPSSRGISTDGEI
jgi:mono/diheme cytochrome c family protein